MVDSSSKKPTINPLFPENRWIEGLLIVGFWAFLFTLEIAQEAFDFRGPQGVSAAELKRSGIEYSLWLLLTPLTFWLTSTFNFHRGSWHRDLSIHVFVTIAVTVLTQAYSHYSFRAFIVNDPVSFPSFIDSLLAFRFLDELMLYLFVLAAGFARNYFHQYQKNLEETVQLRTEAAALKTQLVEARLQALRMQLNPHFLFNTLNAVSILVERDPRGVRKMITRLSDLLRYTLDEENAQEVPLEQELNFLDSYFEIQKIRFQGRLEVEKHIDQDVQHALVPSLILQPIAENAIKHGVSRIVEHGNITLYATRQGERLILSIQDNGPGLEATNSEPSPNGTGQIGLRNTRQRLQELYGKAAHLNLESPVEGGTIATISLPYHTREDLVTVAA